MDFDLESLIIKPRHQLLHFEGGWSIGYHIDVEHIDVEQDKQRPDFGFTAIEGSVRVKWPQLYVKILAEPVVDPDAPHLSTETYDREAVHDFSINVGMARSQKSIVQRTPYRHAFSSRHCYPLTFQYFEETSQFFYPEKELGDPSEDADFWLPTALKNFPYMVLGHETVEETECTVLERPGIDKIWLATDQSGLLLRREMRDGVSQAMRRRITASDVREFGENVWFPFKQIREDFYPADWEPGSQERVRTRLTMHITDIRVGQLTNRDFEIEIPEGAELQDHTRDLTWDALWPEELKQE